MKLLKADNSRQSQETIGGALGWLSGRGRAGGAVEGGGSSARRTPSTEGGVSLGVVDTSTSWCECSVAHSGQSGQSAGWAGPSAGGVPSSSVWQRTPAATTGSVRGTVAPTPSWAISASSTANSPDKGNRRVNTSYVYGLCLVGDKITRPFQRPWAPQAAVKPHLGPRSNTILCRVRQLQDATHVGLFRCKREDCVPRHLRRLRATQQVTLHQSAT
jgi:hypothetical protein